MRKLACLSTTKLAVCSMIAAIFLSVEIPPIAGTAAAATAALLPALQPQLEALLPQSASELAQALLLAFVVMSVSLAGRNAADNRPALAIGAVLASGAWTAGDLPAAGNAVLAAITWAEVPVVDWVSQLVEAAAPK